MILISAAMDDMKMPKCCYNCRFCQSVNLHQINADHWCMFDNEWMSKKEKFNPYKDRLDNCPLTEMVCAECGKEINKDDTSAYYSKIKDAFYCMDCIRNIDKEATNDMVQEEAEGDS